MPPTTTPGVRKTVDQLRGGDAYIAVSARLSDEKKLREAYAGRVRDLPLMIRRNGLGQTVAFLTDSKDDPAKKLVLTDLESWLCKRAFLTGAPQTSLLAYLINQDRDTWWRATNEAIAFAVWLKRWSEALIDTQSAAHDSAAQSEATDVAP